MKQCTTANETKGVEGRRRVGGWPLRTRPPCPCRALRLHLSSFSHSIFLRLFLLSPLPLQDAYGVDGAPCVSLRIPWSCTGEGGALLCPLSIITLFFRLFIILLAPGAPLAPWFRPAEYFSFWPSRAPQREVQQRGGGDKQGYTHTRMKLDREWPRRVRERTMLQRRPKEEIEGERG